MIVSKRVPTGLSQVGNRLSSRTPSSCSFTTFSSTNAETHPGRDPSLSQLIFTLNQQLKRAVCSQSSCVTKSIADSLAPFRERCADLPLCSFTLDEACQLDKDTPAAMATIRERRNPSLRVNHIPLDALSLVPTYLSFNNDRLWASSVC